MAEPIIEVKNLQVIYNKGKSNEVRSLENINLRVFPQEYMIIYGPSGCGKSTLLYSISGLQVPTAGEVIVEGKDLSQMNKKEKVELHRRGIGMIFQAFYLIPSINTMDNVCLPRIFCGEKKSARKEEGMKLLRRFGIAEQLNKFPSELSGGQQQRVSIARSLINNPQIILADEPVGNLDSASSANVMKILKELNEVDKKTIILVTHNAAHLHYADRIIHMEDGKITTEEVNKEKRPESEIKEEIEARPEEMSGELRLLMRSFKNLSLRELGVVLVPFKARQLMSHILSELTEEQLNAAENILKEFLFKNLDIFSLEKNLDASLNKGGAGWNKQRSTNFSTRIKNIFKQAENISNKEPEQAAFLLTDYLVKFFNLHLGEDALERFASFIRLRIENKLDCYGLQERLDASRYLGGLGLYKGKAEKVVKEVEIILLVKYSS